MVVIGDVIDMADVFDAVVGTRNAVVGRPFSAALKFWVGGSVAPHYMLP
jgi:hypothetical protein